MTTHKLHARIKQLKKQRFWLNTQIVWTKSDYAEDSRLLEEINRLEKELQKRKGD